jgi:predicted SnoaL-like aldol condensation-catalyzing enzyme
MARAKSNPQIIDFYALSQEHWTDKELQNAKVVVEFFQTLMNEHDFEATLQRFGDIPYVQHNRAIPDGIPGLVGYVKQLVKRFPDYGFDVKRIIASDDFVVLHSHATLKAAHRADESKGFIVTDTFRFEDGQLAEHWDALQPIDFATRYLFLLTGGAMGNQNPIF